VLYFYLLFNEHWSTSAMPSPANPDLLRRAIALATENVLRNAGGPFGAVIVRDGRIVGEGVNTVTAANDPTVR
jgi:tRNA(Arg) A34 adenosine deaminase TadA